MKEKKHRWSDRQSKFLPTSSVPNCLQWLLLGLAKVRSWQPNPGILFNGWTQLPKLSLLLPWIYTNRKLVTEIGVKSETQTL